MKQQQYKIEDIRTEKIAVKLKNKEEYYKIITKLKCKTSSDYRPDEKYYGFDDTGFGYLYDSEIPNYILIESIDDIYFGEEEVTIPKSLITDYETKVVELIEENKRLWQEVDKKSKEILALDDEIREIQQTSDKEVPRYFGRGEHSVRDLEKMVVKCHAIINLKNEEIDSLKDKIVSQTPPTTETPFHEQRNNMAWELLLKFVESSAGKHLEVSSSECFEIVDSFVEKSKELKL